jgi:hypothetical protein
MIFVKRVQRKMSSPYNDRVRANIQPGFWFMYFVLERKPENFSRFKAGENFNRRNT